MLKNLRMALMTAFCVGAALFLGILPAGGDELADPLKTVGDYTIIRKSRATISFVGKGRDALTFVAQSMDVTEDLGPVALDFAKTKASELGCDNTRMRRVFSMTSASGVFPLDYEYEFYGEKYTARDVPRSVICNVYFTRYDSNGDNKINDNNKDDSYVYVELVDENGRVGKPLHLSFLPNPVFTVNYQGDAKRTHNDAENSVLSHIVASDWNGDGYSDFLLAYVHKVGDQDSNPSKSNNNRVVLVYMDGKTLRESAQKGSTSPLNYYYDDTRVFGTGGNFPELLAGATPALSLRLAVGDPDGDGTDEVGVWHTSPSGHSEGLGSARDDNKFYLLDVDVKNKKFTNLVSKEIPESYAENDVVGIAMGDLNGDKRDEIILLHGETPAVRMASKTNISIYRYEGGALTALVRNKQYPGDDAKVYDVLEERKKFNDTSPPYHAFSVGSYELSAEDLDGDGRDELIFCRVTHLGSKDSLKVTVHSWPGDIKDLGDYKHFHLTSDNPSGSEGLTPYRIDPNYSCYSMAVDTFHFPTGSSGPAGGEAGMAKQVAVAWQDGETLNWGIFSWNKAEGLSRMGSGQRENALFYSDNPRNKKDYQTDQVRPQLLATDFGFDTLVLGKPIAFDIEDNIEVAAVLGAPPKHIDIISGDINGKMDENGNSYAESLFGEKNYSTQFINTKTSKAVEQKVSGFTNNLGVGGSLSFSKVHRQKPNIPLFQAGLSIAGQQAEKNMESKGVTATISGSVNAHGDDQVCFTSRNYTVWRYPILFPEDLRLADITDENGDTYQDQQFMQFVVLNSDSNAADTLSPTHGSKISWYEPPYDPNNLFTYPAKIQNVWGYNTVEKKPDPLDQWNEFKGLLLGTVQNFDVSNMDPNSIEFKWSIDQTDENSTTRGVTVGASMMTSVPIPLPIPKRGMAVTVNLNDDFSWQQTTTSTISTSESGGIKLSMSNTTPNPHSGQPIDDTGFTIGAALLNTDDGTLMAQYAVTELKNTHHVLWGSHESPYQQHSDPGLLLPFRFNSAGDPSSSTNSHLIRGITFSQEHTGGNLDFSGMPTKTLLMGTKTKVSFRVVNYSFVAASRHTAKLYWQPIPKGGSNISNPPDLAKASLVTSGVEIPEIRGREERLSEDNWVDVDIDWQAPSERGLGYLFVVLEPDPSEPQLSVDNDWGYTLVGLGSREDFESLRDLHVARITKGVLSEKETREDGALNLSIQNITAEKENGDKVDLKALPRNEKIDIAVTVRLDAGKSGIKFLPKVSARLLADRSIIAAEELPILLDDSEWTLKIQLDPTVIAPETKRVAVMVHSPYLKIRSEEGAADNFMLLSFEGESDENDETDGSGGSGGCNAGAGSFTLFAALALAGAAFLRRCSKISKQR